MARQNTGFVLMHRKLNTSAIGRDGYACAVWLKLILWANWVETRIDGEPVLIGELVTGIDELAEHTGFHRSTVHRKLVEMEKLQMLRRSKRRKGTLITIVNYKEHQPQSSSLETTQETDERQERDKRETDERQERDLSNKLINLNNITTEQVNRGFARVDPPQKQLERWATEGAARTIAAIRNFQGNSLQARRELGDSIWGILEQQYPDHTWQNFCTSYQQAVNRKAEAFFRKDLKDHFEAFIPSLIRGQALDPSLPSESA